MTRTPDEIPDNTPDRHWSHWLTRVALVLSIGLVFARATTLETIRNPLDVNPGSAAIPRGTGAAEGLVLDLIACIPALLVLTRRAIDPAFTLRCTWSIVPLILLGIWAMLSTLWSADKFAALVSSTHLLTAFIFCWSTFQLVTGWLRVRLVTAACFGLLLVLIAQGFYFRLVELPDLKSDWMRNRTTILKERGWDPDSFSAKQFENRVLGGEMLGFSASPNSFGAFIVLLSMVSAGLLLQKTSEREASLRELSKGSGFPCLMLGAALGLALVVIYFTHSRTALATPVLGTAAFAGLFVFKDWLRRHARVAYVLGVALVLLAAVAVIGHGLAHGSLVHISLTFRWRYWLGAFEIFKLHPWLGVGWENFGLHYLAARLPIASEEIKDPHNFIVRIFTELGAVGGALLFLWLLRFAWEVTRPRSLIETPPASSLDVPFVNSLSTSSSPIEYRNAIGRDRKNEAKKPSAVPAALAMGSVGFLLSIATSIDFNQSPDYSALEILRRAGFFCVFILGVTIALVRAIDNKHIDDRPAPWVLYGSLIGLALFLLHNLIDFSIFENGLLFTFMLIAGAALGISAKIPSRRSSVLIVKAKLLIAIVAWLTAACLLVAPIVIAESRAASGDEAMRQQQFPQAVRAFTSAADRVPFNADYAYRAAMAAYWGQIPESKDLIARAIVAQPNGVRYLLLRARMNSNMPAPTYPPIFEDYRKAVALDPYNVSTRIEFAELLRRAGESTQAREQYQRALEVNDELAPDEPERLRPDQIESIRQAILALPG